MALAVFVGIMAVFLILNILTRPIPFTFLSFGVTGLGFVLFLASKLSLVSKGRLFSFGTKAMSRPFRVCYYLGYALIVLGALGVVLVMSFHPG